MNLFAKQPSHDFSPPHREAVMATYLFRDEPGFATYGFSGAWEALNEHVKDTCRMAVDSLMSYPREAVGATLGAPAEVNLVGFAREVMKAWPDGGVDGFDLQDLGSKYGLLVPATPTAKEAAEWGLDEGDPWYRVADLQPDATPTDNVSVNEALDLLAEVMDTVRFTDIGPELVDRIRDLLAKRLS